MVRYTHFKAEKVKCQKVEGEGNTENPDRGPGRVDVPMDQASKAQSVVAPKHRAMANLAPSRAPENQSRATRGVRANKERANMI